jgi:hypothetical protein
MSQSAAFACDVDDRGMLEEAVEDGDHVLRVAAGAGIVVVLGHDQIRRHPARRGEKRRHRWATLRGNL